MFDLFGKFFILFGIIFILFGLFLSFFEKIPFLGKLPGDILIKKENFVFYFPITSSLLLSLILTLIFWLIQRFTQ